MSWLRTLVLTLLPAVAACGPRTHEWKEELVLHDGKKIIATRTDIMGGAMEPGWTEAPPRERRIQIPDPADPSHRYELSIPGGADFLLADFAEGAAWVLVYPGTGDAKSAMRCGHGYVLYRATKTKKWDEVSLKDLPRQISRLNMTAFANHEQRKRDFLSAEDIAKANDIASREVVQLPEQWSLRQQTRDGRSTDCFTTRLKGEKK